MTYELASILEVSHSSGPTSRAWSSASSSESAVTMVHWTRVIVKSAMPPNLARSSDEAAVA